ncbi:MAG: hypothetical protein FJ276_14955, partial [Planctomycetes bacterium]|nr:hypothetical protein [Planctomycetota bacterium]
MINRDSVFWLMLAVGLCVRLSPVCGQEPGGGDGGLSVVAAEDDDRPLREQTIYVPYDKLRQVFEKEGRGVFLPYEKFQELWKAAQKELRRPEVQRPPVDALINEIDSEATIADAVVAVRATLKIEVFGDEWVSVPLRLRDSAISSATLGDQAARIVFDEQVGYKWLYRKSGKEPEQVELKLEYSRAYTKAPGQSSVVFEAPQAPINRWRIRVPEAGMAVQVEPMIAATRSPEPAPGADPATSDLLAFVGVAPTVRIAWNPKAEGASGLAAFATVQTEQQLTIAEGVARSTVKLEFEISRATLAQLVLEVPANQKIVNVYDRNVQRWKPESVDGVQRVLVDLFEPIQGKQTLVVELEEFSDATESTYDVTAAVVTAVGVGRQQGIVVARLEAGLQGEATKRVGLMQLDEGDLPQELQGGKWDFAYRYGAVPYELQLRVEKVLPRISVTELIDVDLSSDQLLMTWQGVYTIEEAGVFQLQLDLPDGFEVRSIHGVTVGDAQAVAVDAHHRVAGDGPTWRVNLSKKAFGKVALAAQLRRALDDPNLRAPTNEVSTIAIPLPRATAADVEFSQGAVVVRAPESLRVNPAKSDGLRSISSTEAYSTIPRTPPGSAQLNPVLAFAFATGATDLAVTADRRRPQVTVEQLLRAEIEAGVVKYHATFYFNVKYSGVNSLRIDIPSSVSANTPSGAKSLRKEEITPKPDDLADKDGYTAWSFAGEAELLGEVELQLEWDQEISELGVGKSQDIAIPRLVPMNVARATGQIVLSKSESIDIQPIGQPEGLRPIDPQNELMRQVKVDSAAMAFAFVSQWSLGVRATRYELEASKLTSIERGLVRMVALSQSGATGNEGELSVQAIYRMRSARQRLAIRLPQGHRFDSQPLRINGKAVTPEKESDTTIFAPLLDLTMDQTFLLELRYTVPGGPAQLDLPAFPDDPAVQKVMLCAYLPDTSVLLSRGGPWSNEREEIVFSGVGINGRVDDDGLINWVTEDPEGGRNPAVAEGLANGAKS